MFDDAQREVNILIRIYPVLHITAPSPVRESIIFSDFFSSSCEILPLVALHAKITQEIPPKMTNKCQQNC